MLRTHRANQAAEALALGPDWVDSGLVFTSTVGTVIEPRAPIPGIGWMAGMISLPVVAGASTYAVGRVFQRHFEGGGSVYDIGVENADLRMPNLKGAYHRQCLNCHRDWAHENEC